MLLIINFSVLHIIDEKFFKKEVSNCGTEIKGRATAAENGYYYWHTLKIYKEDNIILWNQKVLCCFISV